MMILLQTASTTCRYRSGRTDDPRQIATQSDIFLASRCVVPWSNQHTVIGGEHAAKACNARLYCLCGTASAQGRWRNHVPRFGATQVVSRVSRYGRPANPCSTCSWATRQAQKQAAVQANTVFEKTCWYADMFEQRVEKFEHHPVFDQTLTGPAQLAVQPYPAAHREVDPQAKKRLFCDAFLAFRLIQMDHPSSRAGMPVPDWCEAIQRSSSLCRRRG